MANVLLICKLCKKEFNLPQWRVNQGRGKFCSIKCLNKRTGKLSAHWEGGKDVRACKECGKRFVAWPYQKTKYCSCKCAAQESKRRLASSIFNKQRTGEKCWNWKGGKEFWAPRSKKKYNCIDCGIKIWSIKHPRCIKCAGLANRKQGTNKREIDKLERQRFRDSIQREVFIRDDYTCQMCGVRGVSLTVDHMQSWKDYVELRFNINNCRTLCSGCHYFITFGRPMPESAKNWGRGLIRTIT